MIEHFQDQDWIGIPHETFVIVYSFILVAHFTRTLTFSWSLVLSMRKVSVGFINKLLLILAQSLYYVLYYKHNTLASTHDFCWECTGDLDYYLGVQPIDDVTCKLSDLVKCIILY